MYRVRSYHSQDREAVWKLVADTAFFGAPVEAFLDGRALYCVVFAAYYTDYEPGRLWVAEAAGTVVGYVMGCGDGRRRVQAFCARILPAVVGGLLQGRYHVGRKTLRFVLRVVRESLEGKAPSVSPERFPGHLHIGVAAPARGQGIGRVLLENCLAQFWATGVSGVHLLTTDRNRAACRLYESVGFRLLNIQQTRLWHGLVEGGVQNRTYGIRPDWYKPAE